MQRRSVHALLAVVGVLVLGVFAGYALLALSFGSPAEWTLEAERVPADRVAENLTMDLPPREAAVATRAVENGSAETVGYTLPIESAYLERNGPYVERNGTYHRLSVEPGGERTVARPVASFEAANDTDGAAVARESLPGPDRKAVTLAYRATGYGRRRTARTVPARRWSTSTNARRGRPGRPSSTARSSTSGSGTSPSGRRCASKT